MKKTQSNMLKMLNEDIEGCNNAMVSIRNSEQVHCLVAGMLSTITEASKQMDTRINFDIGFVEQVAEGSIGASHDMTGLSSIERVRNLAQLVLDRLEAIEHLSARRKEYLESIK